MKNINLIKKATNITDEDIFKAVQDQLLSNIVEIEVENVNESMKKQLEEKEIIIREKTLRYSEIIF